MSENHLKVTDHAMKIRLIDWAGMIKTYTDRGGSGHEAKALLQRKVGAL